MCSSDLTDMVVARVRDGLSTASVRRLLGPPFAATREVWRFAGLNVHFNDRGKCYAMVLTTARWHTARGLRVGDTIERVKQLYGRPGHEDSLVISYDRTYREPTELTMVVEHRAGRVIAIHVGALIDLN